MSNLRKVLSINQKVLGSHFEAVLVAEFELNTLDYDLYFDFQG